MTKSISTEINQASRGEANQPTNLRVEPLITRRDRMLQWAAELARRNNGRA
jgi:hypothetical protein